MKWTPLRWSLLSIISLSQILVLIFFLFYKNLNSVLGSWSDSSSFSIYLKVDASDAQKIEITDYLKKAKQIDHFDFISREQSAKDFQKSFGEYASGLLSQDELIDLTPEVIEVFPLKEFNFSQKLDFFKTMAIELKNFLGIDEVADGSSWINRFAKIDQIIKSVGAFCFIILLFSMGFLSALMIRVLVEDSKSEIEVYNLLGATRWSINKIFLKDLLLLLVLSLGLSFFSISSLFFLIRKTYFQKEFVSILSDRIVFLSPAEVVAFASVFILFIAVSGFISLTSSLNRLSHFTYD